MQSDRLAKPLNVAGHWRVTHHVEASQRADFVGLDIAFQITLTQDGGQVAGEGEKFLVDRKPASAGEASRLEITGWAHETEVRISLMEVGPTRTTIGTIDWTAVDTDRMAGRFSVDLAKTSGRSEAVRQRN